MKILVHRSIPLSQTTREAFKATEHDVFFSLKTRTLQESIQRAAEKGYDVLWNHGNSEHHDVELYDYLVWNPKTVVDIMLSPGSMRRSVIGHLLPPRARTNFPAWIKNQGRGGRGKEFVEEWQDENLLQMLVENPEMDVQQHVEGEEYRVLTVGPTVVQCFSREGTPRTRNYTWTGVVDAPGPVASIARYASSLLPTYRTIIGWDIIKSQDRVYVLEGNTAPGLNEASAQRITDEISQIINGYTDLAGRRDNARTRAARNRWYRDRVDNTTAFTTHWNVGGNPLGTEQPRTQPGRGHLQTTARREGGEEEAPFQWLTRLDDTGVPRRDDQRARRTFEEAIPILHDNGLIEDLRCLQTIEGEWVVRVRKNPRFPEIEGGYIQADIDDIILHARAHVTRTLVRWFSLREWRDISIMMLRETGPIGENRPISMIFDVGLPEGNSIQFQVTNTIPGFDVLFEEFAPQHVGDQG